MQIEYLYNNDTQEINQRVCELATSNEPALRQHCQEVSRQTDTSSLCLQKEVAGSVECANAVISAIAKQLENLSQSLLENAGVFRTRDGKSDFPMVCRATVRIEEERLQLMRCISALTQIRRNLASEVAKANRILHFLSLAARAVSQDLYEQYTQITKDTQEAYERLTSLDAPLCSAQDFYMSVVERHLPAFMEQLRTAADFNHAGQGLDRRAIRALCSELLLLFNRRPNVSF